jgi:[ribosomal protein S5]-alanine N-acetyltransferase
VKAPERLVTHRLVLRRPADSDVEPIFLRYAGDPDVTRYLAWPMHGHISQTQAFLGFSNAEWAAWPAGPYLIECRESGRLLGGTGFSFETPQRAVIGYVLARDAWGHGYATESVVALVTLGPQLGLRTLYALCHADHTASRHVLEKCGFVRDEGFDNDSVFPNLGSTSPQRTLRYRKAL